LRETFRRIGRDVRNRRNIEAYVVAFLALFFALSSVIGEVIPMHIRWAALLAGVGLLVYRVTVPDRPESVDELLRDRTVFDDTSFALRIAKAREVWIYAPSAINLLGPQNCEALRSKILSHRDGILRVVILDPAAEEGIRVATRQLDGAVDFPVQNLVTSLASTARVLDNMDHWVVDGDFQYRLIDYNPGFSMVAVDPGKRDGRIIVEFHAFHNEATSTRMHFEISRSQSDRWYSYWMEQFDRIWHSAAPPEKLNKPKNGLYRPN
jgi:hypothetical protein